MNYFNYLFVFLCYFVIVYGQLEDVVDADRQLGDPCQLDSQCSPRWSLCGKSYKCDCWTRFLRKENECLATVEAFCTEDSDCSTTLPNSYCDKDKCKCRDTFTVDTDRKTCLSPKRINETCKLEEECKHYLGIYGSCMINPTNYSSKMCTCMQNYHPSRLNGTCILNVGLNGRCFNDDECYTTGPIQLVCYEDQCKCPHGYISDDDRNCRDGAPALVQSFIIVLLMYSFTKLF